MNGRAGQAERRKISAKYPDRAVHTSFPSQRELDKSRVRALARGLLVEVHPHSGDHMASTRYYAESREGDKWVTQEQAQMETGLELHVAEPQAELGSVAVLGALEAAPAERLRVVA